MMGVPLNTAVQLKHVLCIITRKISVAANRGAQITGDKPSWRLIIFGPQCDTWFMSILLLLLLLHTYVLNYLLYLLTAIQFSLRGSSPYTSTDNTNNIHKRNKAYITETSGNLK